MIYDNGWAGGPAHAKRNRAKGMALEWTGWETTKRWAWHWSMDILQMREDLVVCTADEEPEAADSVAPEIPMLNEIAREPL